MGSCISKANSRKRDSTAFSTANYSAFQQPVLSPASSIQHEQLNNASLDQINGSLNDADERLIQKLRSENEELKVKLAASDEKDKRLEVYEDLIGELRKKCAAKDKQLVENEKYLVEKNKQLVERARLIELLEAKCAENEGHLQSKVNELQAECDKKEKQLIYKKSLIEKLQADCTEKDIQMTSTLNRLKELEKNMYDSSKLVDTFLNCGLECKKQKQFNEALVHCQNAIELETVTQNRSSTLAQLFANKACYNYCLKQYQKCIDAATLALQYDPYHKMALNNRGAAYEYLRQYANARQDYEKALQLDPSYEAAYKNLKDLQKLINASSS